MCVCASAVSRCYFTKKDQLLLFIIQKLKSDTDLKKIKQNKCLPIGVGGGGSVIYPLPIPFPIRISSDLLILKLEIEQKR